MLTKSVLYLYVLLSMYFFLKKLFWVNTRPAIRLLNPLQGDASCRQKARPFVEHKQMFTSAASRSAHRAVISQNFTNTGPFRSMFWSCVVIILKYKESSTDWPTTTPRDYNRRWRWKNTLGDLYHCKKFKFYSWSIN